MRVLITGATGLIGTSITRLCHEKGIGVNYLTTSKGNIENRENYRGYLWDPAAGQIDARCLDEVGSVINLAGENVFKPWTEKNKKKILESRVNSAALLYQALEQNQHEVHQVVSASAIGVYPSSFEKMYDEDEDGGADTFLAEVVRKWEAAVDSFTELGLKVAKIRIGLVLSNRGGALPQMQQPVKLNLGAALGTGRQWQSWIHIEDLARIFLHVVENGLEGTYNAVAPNPVLNKELMEKVAANMGKKLWLPNVPAFVLKLAMGEMSQMVLESQLVSSDKIESTGFYFNYVNLEPALKDLENKKTG